MRVSVLFLCSLFLVLLTGVFGEEGHEEHESIFDHEAGDDHELDEHELEHVIEEVVNDPAHIGECPTAAELIEEHDANNNTMIDETEFGAVAAELLTCVSELTCAETVALTVTGLAADGDAAAGTLSAFTCTAGDGHAHEEDEDHDEHGSDDHDEDSDDHDDHGDEAEPAAFLNVTVGTVSFACVANAGAEEEDHDDSLSKGEAWLFSMIAVILVSSLSLVGLLLLGVKAQTVLKHTHDLQAFAAGALIAAALLHMIPEAAIEVGTDYKLGLPVLGGYVFTYVLEQVIRGWRRTHKSKVGGLDAIGHAHEHPHPHPPVAVGAEEHKTTATPVILRPAASENKESPVPGKSLEDGDPTNVPPVSPTAITSAVAPSSKELLGEKSASSAADPILTGKSKPLFECDAVIWVILIGDFVHNLVDGVAISAAFLACDKSVGWSVTFAVALHEIPQEIGDYFVLVLAGLSRTRALLFNLLSAMGAVLGALIVLALEELSHEANAYLVLFAAGTLLFIGATDLVPDTLHVKSTRSNIRQTFLFCLATIIVGLSLIHDKHCENGLDGEDTGHAH